MPRTDRVLCMLTRSQSMVLEVVRRKLGPKAKLTDAVRWLIDEHAKRLTAEGSAPPPPTG